MMNKEKDIIKFTGKVVRKIYGDTPEFRIYAVDVPQDQIDSNNLKKTKYGNVSIMGALHELGEGLSYNIEAIEENGKNGYTYKVINITRDKPNNSQEFYYFIKDIVTEQQAEEIWKSYPNFVQIVIDGRQDEIDLSKLHNIGEYRLNKIIEKVVDNYALAELIQEFKGLLSMKIIRQIYNKYASVGAVKEALKNDPYACLCELSGVGFKTADAIIAELEKEKILTFDYDFKTSLQRCVSAMLYLIEENENTGNTCMDLVELHNQVNKLVPACANLYVEGLKTDKFYYDKDKRLVAKMKTYSIEKKIADKIKYALNHPTKWNIDTSKYQKVNDCELSDQQKMVTKMVCDNQIGILNGFGGSGKSFTTQSIINMAKDNKKSFVLFSPTGKASKVLEEYTKEKASTIHRGLMYNPSEGWGINEEFPLSCDLVIVDEFSMTDVFLFSHLLDAIDFDKTKLLLIGDSAQLPSVGAGNLLHDFMQFNKIPIITLDHIFRYEEGGLSKVATDIRKGVKYLKNISNSFTYFGNTKDYAFLNVEDSKIVRNTLMLYKKIYSKDFQEKNNLNLKVSDVQVLTSKNVGEQGTNVLNNELQKISNPNYGTSKCIKLIERMFYKDDLVMQMQNNYHAELYQPDYFGINKKEVMIANGETGIIKEVYPDKGFVVIDFDGVLVKYYKNNLTSVSLGYACTIHKSQGSSIPIVILLTPKSHHFMLNSNLLYVGVSRTKKMCFHLGDKDVINRCVPQKENFERNTFMQELLKD